VLAVAPGRSPTCFADKPADSAGFHAASEIHECVSLRTIAERHQINEFHVQALGDERQRGERRDHQPFFDAAEVPLRFQPRLVRKLFLSQSELFAKFSYAGTNLSRDWIGLCSAGHRLDDRFILDETSSSRMNLRKRRLKAEEEPFRGIQGVPGPLDETAATVRAEVARCAARINEHIGRLSAVGNQAFYSTGGLSREATAEELHQLSAGLRGVVCHALAVLTEIQSEVGRLDMLAVFREVENPNE
jgi:hypothetical protein